MTLDDKGVWSVLKPPAFTKIQHVLLLSIIRAVGDYISGAQRIQEKVTYAEQIPEAHAVCSCHTQDTGEVKPEPTPTVQHKGTLSNSKLAYNNYQMAIF